MIGGQVSASGQCNVGAHGRCVGRITSSGWIARSPLESLEVPDVDGQELRDAVNVHACRQPRVMHLHTPDCMCDEKPPPTVVHVPAVRRNCLYSARCYAACPRDRELARATAQLVKLS